MAGKNVEVRLNRKTLTVARQVYPLQNLARVQVVKVKYHSTWHRQRAAWQGAAALGLLIVLNLLAVNSRGNLSDALGLLNIPAVIAIVTGTAARLVRVAIRRPRHVLLLETNGNPVGALGSTNLGDLEKLADAIANAIENPPETPQVFHIGDVVLGDQINQDGDYNIGKWAASLGT